MPGTSPVTTSVPVVVAKAVVPPFKYHLYPLVFEQPEAVSVAVLVKQIVTPPPVMVGAVGTPFSVTTKSEDFTLEQFNAEIQTAEYVPEAFTVIEGAVTPFDHLTAPVVQVPSNTADPPHTPPLVLVLLIFTTGAAGISPTVMAMVLRFELSVSQPATLLQPTL